MTGLSSAILYIRVLSVFGDNGFGRISSQLEWTSSACQGFKNLRVIPGTYSRSTVCLSNFVGKELEVKADLKLLRLMRKRSDY